jgi:transposase InsO family protein
MKHMMYSSTLRGKDTTAFKIILMSNLGEAHSNKIIKLCRKHGIFKQTTAEYTPQLNAFVERWFQTVGEMSRSQILQFDMEKEFWEDSRRHAN